jgi:hypothetical protein
MRRLAFIGATGLLLLSAATVFAATGNGVWRAPLANTGTRHGGATLAELANGKSASLAVKLYDVKPGTTVTVTLYDGANGTGTAIATHDTFKAPAAGPATHRFWLTKTELAALKGDLAKKDTISVSVSAALGKAVPVLLTGNFAAVK